MRATLGEETWEGVVPLFEALPPTPESYPYPALKATGMSESRTFAAVVLENGLVRATFVPALGGRLVSWQQEGEEHVAPGVLAPGPRGDGLRLGLGVTHGQRPRLNDLGPVEAAEAEGEGEVGLWLAEAAGGNELSWHLRWSLRKGEACLRGELRVVNRSRSEALPLPGLFVPNGLSVGPHWEVAHGVGRSRRHPPELGPYGTATLSFAVALKADAVGEGAAATYGPEGWTVRALRHLPESRLFVQAEGGTFEAPLSLDAGERVTYPLSELPPGSRSLAIRDAEGEWALPPQDDGPDPEWTPARSWPGGPPERWLHDGLLGGVASVRAGHTEKALERLPEHPLVWWQAALEARLRDDEFGDERANAHFLAPLEPLLRAEAFLATEEKGREPSPLVAPLAERPENLVEVAARLLELEQWAEATRWLDEALRHEELPMLHLLQAYAFVASGKMPAEAANHLRRAALLGPRPPYPYREVEREALRTLAQRFPNEEVVKWFSEGMSG